ncbi:hypothetical protein Tco_0385703 [Tanacetum coccineum]
MFMDLKTKLETTTKNHQASIQNLEAKFDRFSDKQSVRPSGSLPSSTQPNPKGSSSKPYQPAQARNEHVNAVFTQSGKSYDPPINPNDQPNDSETPVNFDSDDEEEESTPQPKTQKPVKETPIPKPYKLKIPYPQRLRKEKVKAQYGMPNYGKFLKELVSNKHKLEQISSAFLSDESSAMIQNKVPPKLGDPRSFLIPCIFSKAFSCNALAELDFVILEIEEDSKVSLILGRPFLHTTDAVIRVKQKQLNLGVGTERMTFLIDSAMKHSYSNDDTYFSIIDEILEEDFDALLGEENSESKPEEEPRFEKITFDSNYKIKTSLKDPPLDLALKTLPEHLEYVFLEEPTFLPVIISSQLFEQNKNKLIFVLKRYKQTFAWKITDILGIYPSFCKHKIQLLENKNPVVQKQRRLNPNMQEVVKKEIIKLLDTGFIYPIADSPWVIPIHCVPKKGGITVVTNEKDELVPTRTVTGWREGIVLGRKVSCAGLEVDKAKIDVISKLPPPTNVKGIRRFLGHASFYRCFIKDFLKIARPLTKLLEKYTPFEFNDE